MLGKEIYQFPIFTIFFFKQILVALVDYKMVQGSEINTRFIDRK